MKFVQIGLSKRVVSLMLVAAGFTAVLFYLTCIDVCAGVAGTMAGIDLKYIGLAYLSAVGAGVLMRRQSIVFALLSAGIGAESYLVGYQIKYGEFCPFCMVFGIVVVCLWILQFDRRRWRMMVLMPIGLAMIWLTFDAALPAYGATAPGLPEFGRHGVQLRVYTDYFCSPCSRIEPEMEAFLKSLVDGGKARVIFIDVPLHRNTPMYARLYLRIIDQRSTITDALRLRRLLFDAAEEGIVDAQRLEVHIQNAGFTPTGVDPKPLLDTCNAFFKHDGIRATPTLVVDRGTGAETVDGGSAILSALKALLEN